MEQGLVQAAGLAEQGLALPQLFSRRYPTSPGSSEPMFHYHARSRQAGHANLVFALEAVVPNVLGTVSRWGP